MPLLINRITRKDVRITVANGLKIYPSLELKRGRKHVKMVHTKTKDFLVLPTSPSDHRATKNLQRDIKRLGEHGTGLIAARIH